MGDALPVRCYEQRVTANTEISSPTNRMKMKRILFVGFFLSGMAGLVDQVVWSKYLAGLLGSTTVAHTIVLATFMMGLAAGNAAFGRRSDRGQRLIRLYAVLEIAIGVFCLFFPEIFSLFTELYIASCSRIKIVKNIPIHKQKRVVPLCFFFERAIIGVLLIDMCESIFIILFC